MNYQWNPYAYPYWQHQTYEPPHTGWYRNISIIDAINIAQQRIPGEVVEAELESKQGMQYYEMDIITSDGTKYEVNVERGSGEIISVERD